MTFRPESLESEWKVFQRLLRSSGFKVRKHSDFGVFLCAHPCYTFLLGQPSTVPACAGCLPVQPLNCEPSRHGWESLLQTSGLVVDTDLHVLQKPMATAALTTATRAKPNRHECSRFRITASLGWGQASSRPHSGASCTIPWGMRHRFLQDGKVCGSCPTWQFLPPVFSQRWLEMQEERRRLEKRERGKDSSRGRRGSIFLP